MGKKHRETRAKYVQHLLEIEKSREAYLHKRRTRGKRPREEDDEVDGDNVDVADVLPPQAPAAAPSAESAPRKLTLEEVKALAMAELAKRGAQQRFPASDRPPAEAIGGDRKRVRGEKH